MTSYPTHVFLELLNDLNPRIKWLRERSEDGVVSNHYESTSGSLVMIDCSDETVDETEGKAYLRQLGLDDLIDALFP